MFEYKAEFPFHVEMSDVAKTIGDISVSCRVNPEADNVYRIETEKEIPKSYIEAFSEAGITISAVD